MIFSGCGGGGNNESDDQHSSDTSKEDPWDVWTELQARLNTSPDHLVAQADAVVASKDPEAIFVFVRDRIRNAPGRLGTGMVGSATDVRWGIRGVLRSGVGTFREKAELLAELYRRAGFSAEVVTGPVSFTAEEIRKLFRPTSITFDPKITDSQWSSWRASLHVMGHRKSQPFDEQALESKRLAQEILSKGSPDWPAAAQRPWTSLRETPLVKVTVRGEPKFANPAIAGLAFGMSGTTRTPTTATSTHELLPVKVTLSYATTANPDVRVPLLEHTWRAEDVVGRQIVAQLVPALDWKALAHTPIGEVHAFIPVLAVQGPDVTPLGAQALMATGKPITRWGQLITTDATSGKVLLDAEPIGSMEEMTDAIQAELVAKVASVEIAASAHAFPTMALKIRPLDADGHVVPGLSTNAFVIDDGGPRSHILTSSAPKPPRVALIIDGSTSIPAEFRGAPMAALARQFAEQIHAQIPNAEFRVFGLSSAKGVWTTDPEEIERNAQDVSSIGSPIWGGVLGAINAGASIAILITDGHATDVPSMNALRRVRSGPPVIAIHVKENDPDGRATLDRITGLDGGDVFSVANSAQASDVVIHSVVRDYEWRYRDRYLAPNDGSTERMITVRTRDGRIVATTIYSVPPSAERTPDPRIVGLYITVNIGDRSTERVLAGNPGKELDPSKEEQYLKDVESSVYGSTVIAIEGSAPTHSALLQDVLTARFALRPLTEASAQEAYDAALQAIDQRGLPASFPLLPAIMPSIAEDNESFTFETDMRAVMMTVRPNLDTKQMWVRIDVLPLTRFATLSGDQAAAFARTAERSARIALAEAAAFPTSTVSMLNNQPLVPLVAGATDISDAVPGLPIEDRILWNDLFRPYRNTHRLVPQSGSPHAFWSIDPETGSLLGVLPNGMGGGENVQDIRLYLEKIDAYLGLMEVGLGVTGAPFAMGVIVSYGKTLAHLYAQAAIVISTLEVVDAEEEVRKEIFGLACDIIRGAVTEHFELTKPDSFIKAIEVLAGPFEDEEKMEDFSVCGAIFRKLKPKDR